MMFDAAEGAIDQLNMQGFGNMTHQGVNADGYDVYTDGTVTLLVEHAANSTNATGLPA